MQLSCCGVITSYRHTLVGTDMPSLHYEFKIHIIRWSPSTPASSWPLLFGRYIYHGDCSKYNKTKNQVKNPELDQSHASWRYFKKFQK